MDRILEVLFQVIERNFESPVKEILIGAFCVVLLAGLVYGGIGGFRRSQPVVPDAKEVPSEPPTTKRLQAELREARETIHDLQSRTQIGFFERYYLYFNGIANASLMLAIAVLLDRYYSRIPARGLQVEIGGYLTVILAGMLISIVFNVLFDIMTSHSDRRTDIINRSFMIAFVVNVLVFVAYHFRYIVV